MDPRTGAILAMANWPKVNPERSRRLGAVGHRGPRRRLQLRTGLDLQGGDRLRGAGTGADHAEHPVQHPGSDPGRRPHDPRRHRTRRRNAHDLPDPRPLEQRRARSRSGNWRDRRASTTWVHRFGFGARTGSRTARRGSGRDAAAGQVLGLLDGQPPDRPGRARHADPDGHRICRDRQRRDPAPAAHHQLDRRASRSPSRPGSASSPQPRRPRSARCSKACSRPEERPARSRSPATSWPARPARPARSTPRPGEYSKSAYVASFIGFAPASDPRLLTAVVVDEPQNGSIYGGTVAAPAFGQIMSFALPYLGIPPG